jgi:hypothetical protein
MNPDGNPKVVFGMLIGRTPGGLGLQNSDPI